MHRESISHWIAAVDAENETCGGSDVLSEIAELRLEESSVLSCPNTSEDSLGLVCVLSYCNITTETPAFQGPISCIWWWFGKGEY